MTARTQSVSAPFETVPVLEYLHDVITPLALRQLPVTKVVVSLPRLV